MGTGPWLDPPADRFVPTSFSAAALVAFSTGVFPPGSPPDVIPQANTGDPYEDQTVLADGASTFLAPNNALLTVSPSVIWGITAQGETGFLPDVWDPEATGFEVETPEGAVRLDLRMLADVTRSVPADSTGWPGSIHAAPAAELSASPPYVLAGQLQRSTIATWEQMVALGADTTASAALDHVFDGMPDRIAAVPLLDLTHTDPLVVSTQWLVADLSLQVRVRHLSRFRWVYGTKGVWRLRQRQSLTGTDSWPLRQRQNGGATGSWPLRQRQRGV